VVACSIAQAQENIPVAKLFEIEFSEISELSGLAKSQQYENTYWAHNDSGDKPRLFALNSDGRVIIPPFLSGRFHGEEIETNKQPWPGLAIELAANIDWEDIAVADGNIYIADIGNNGNARRDLGIYVLTEPNPRAIYRARALKFIPIKYPDQTNYPPAQWRFDSEAIFFHDDALYILTKHRGEGVYHLASGTNLYKLNSWQADQINVLEKVDTNDHVFFVTAADLSPDGKWLAVTGYTELWLFPTPNEQDKWLSGTARRLSLNLSFSGVIEALTWKDESTLLIGNERGGMFQVNIADIPFYNGVPKWEDGMSEFRQMFPIYR